MALYYFEKAPSKPKRPVQKNSGSVANSLDQISRKVQTKLSSIKAVSLLVPMIFIISGFFILFMQIKPYAVHFFQSKISNSLDQQIVSLVPSSYERQRIEYVSDPGANYFSDLLELENISPDVLKYKGEFYLTIEKIKIKDAPITANVDSNNNEVYEKALGKGLAHFKGTDLPNGNKNILIYGHSAAGDYAERNPQDVVTSFTRLFKLNIGDEIEISFEGENYTYIIKKIKEVNPQDTEIILGDGGKTLTLMTCSPPGLNSRRLVVIAIPK